MVLAAAAEVDVGERGVGLGPEVMGERCSQSRWRKLEGVVVQRWRTI